MTKVLSFLRARRQPPADRASCDVSAAYRVAWFLSGPAIADSKQWWTETFAASGDLKTAGQQGLLRCVASRCQPLATAAGDHVDDVANSLSLLDWDSRLILVLADIADHPVDLCARVLDCSVEIAYERLHAARLALHRKTSPLDSTDPDHPEKSCAPATQSGNFPEQLNVKPSAASTASCGSPESKRRGGPHDV